MSETKFKVGDKVTITQGGYGLSEHNMNKLGITRGKTVVTIKTIIGGRATFHEFDGMSVYRSYDGIKLDVLKLVSSGREEVANAIDVVRKHGFFINRTGIYRHIGDKNHTKEEFLDVLFPPEDPHKEEREAIEKEMREMAEKQEALAKRVAELGGS